MVYHATQSRPFLAEYCVFLVLMILASLFLAAVARSLRVTLAADGAADVVVRLPRGGAVLALALVRPHRAERQVELPVLELGRAAVPATRSALSERWRWRFHKITDWPKLLLFGCFS